MKKILVTGAAGFIGSYLVKLLCTNGYDVVGIDNINDYYDVNLKYGRLKELCGVERDEIKNREYSKSKLFDNYRFIYGDLKDKTLLDKLFRDEKFNIVCNLAAQAGVRYSILNPYAYADSNLLGFLNILECCRNNSIEHLVYASSSSVYGMNEKIPFSEDDKTDSPVSLYAATKKSNELMAHAYSHLYHFPVTGLRFFTVYGPWGRPDMAPFLFMNAIVKGNPIRVFNNGNMRRDFTYIEDIVNGVFKVINSSVKSSSAFNIYNIGHGSPVELMDFIHTMEDVIGKKAQCNYEDMQAGDVVCTYADTTKLEKDFSYTASTNIGEGLKNTYEWYKHWMK